MVTVTFLGTGDSFAAGGRGQAAYLVQGGGNTILLDCGPTALMALKRSGTPSACLDAIVISHLHGDHFGGIPFFLLEYVYMEPRRRVLTIAGPPGIEERVLSLANQMFPGSFVPLLDMLQFCEMKPGSTMSLSGTELEAFEVPHQEKALSLGLLVTTDGKRILYSGDSGWTEELVTRSAGTDLFICECSFFDTRLSMHLDYPTLLHNRDRLKTKRLVLTHLGQEVLARKDEVVLDIAEDLQTISIDD
jgi:ribonuclease BN (tRNA processing enzyme)